MEVPQEVRELTSKVEQCKVCVDGLHTDLDLFRVRHPKLDKFADDFYRLDTRFRDAETLLSEALAYLHNLESLIHNLEEYTKDFDLYPGDRIKIKMPAQEPFPAGWAEGTVIDAYWYSDTGWYIELEKESVSPGWQTGYGYWKQREDGGTVEKM